MRQRPCRLVMYGENTAKSAVFRQTENGLVKFRNMRLRFSQREINFYRVSDSFRIFINTYSGKCRVVRHFLFYQKKSKWKRGKTQSIWIFLIIRYYSRSCFLGLTSCSLDNSHPHGPCRKNHPQIRGRVIPTIRYKIHQ